MGTSRGGISRNRGGGGVVLGYAAGRDDGNMRGNPNRSLGILEQSVVAGEGITIEQFVIGTDTHTGVELAPGTYKLFFHVNDTQAGTNFNLQIRTHASFPTTNAELRSLGSNQESAGTDNNSCMTIVAPTAVRKAWFSSTVAAGGSRFEVVRLA